MVQMYGVAQRDTVQLQSWKHDFDFLHNPIVYGVARLLYGVTLSDSVIRLAMGVLNDWLVMQLL